MCLLCFKEIFIIKKVAKFAVSNNFQNAMHGVIGSYLILQEEKITNDCISCDVAECLQECLDLINNVISQPLIRYKKIYGFEDVNGESNCDNKPNFFTGWSKT